MTRDLCLTCGRDGTRLQYGKKANWWRQCDTKEYTKIITSAFINDSDI